VIRTIGALIAIGALVAATVFFAGNPGRVEIVWVGWQIDTSVGVLLAVAVVAALAVGLALRLLVLILGSPRGFFRRRRERRRRAGYAALTRGMVAVAAGDPREAQRYARRAEALLAEPPLTLLLSAQAAQIGGDEPAAKKFFTAMLDRPETEVLGLRGLLNQALRESDRGTARRLAARAAALQPNAGWALSSMFDLEARDGRWEAARDTLAEAAKRRVIAAEPARHHRGVILYELSLAAQARGDSRRAVVLAAEARTLAPDLAAPAVHLARLLVQQGQAGRAAKAVERAWRTAPLPELAEAYGAIWASEAPLARVTRFEHLAAQNPAARESHLALAEAALAAQLWGEARRHLERAVAAEPQSSVPVADNPSPDWRWPAAAVRANGAAWPTPRLCLMMARLEEAEHGDLASMREWLDRAARAFPDPRYVCANCGGEFVEWRSLCSRCGTFDALAWGTPSWTVAGGSLPAAVGSQPMAAIAAASAPVASTVAPTGG
jgi:HemY protein